MSIWLKDFPKTQEDFQELRRSGAQHQPDIEVAIHGVFMIEEDYKVAEVEDDAPIAGLDNLDSALDQDSQYDMEKQKQAEEFVKEDRIRAFQDLMYINKYARNCAENSQLFINYLFKVSE